MKIYIATPINTLTGKNLKDKLRTARNRVKKITQILKSDSQFKGCTFISTFDVNTEEDISEAVAMGNCIRAVMESDAIFMDYRWKSSKGCMLEYRTAELYNKPIYGYLKTGDDDHCCGCCQHFKYEDTDGYGYCSLSTNNPETHCSDVCKGFKHE